MFYFAEKNVRSRLETVECVQLVNQSKIFINALRVPQLNPEVNGFLNKNIVTMISSQKQPKRIGGTQRPKPSWHRSMSPQGGEPIPQARTNFHTPKCYNVVCYG